MRERHSSASCVAASLAIVVAVLATAPACHTSPTVAFARLLDQTASWAASTEFAVAMQTAGTVPRVYVEDLVRHGAREVTQLQTKLQESDDIEPATRSEAAKLSGQLAAILQSATDGGTPAIGELRGIERGLRALARRVRTGDSRPAAGAAR